MEKVHYINDWLPLNVNRILLGLEHELECVCTMQFLTMYPIF